MVVNCVIPSANLRGQGRLSRVTLHFGIFQHQHTHGGRRVPSMPPWSMRASRMDRETTGTEDRTRIRSAQTVGARCPASRAPLSCAVSMPRTVVIRCQLKCQSVVGSSLARVGIGTLSVNNLRGVSALSTRIGSKLWSAVFRLSRRPNSAMRPRFMEEDTTGSWRNAASRRALSSRASYFTDFDNRSRQPSGSKLPKRFSSPAHRRSIIVPRRGAKCRYNASS
jgi:hypothetical protein